MKIFAKILKKIFNKLVTKSTGLVYGIETYKDKPYNFISFRVTFYSFCGYEWVSSHDTERILASNNQVLFVLKELIKHTKNNDHYQRALDIILNDKLAHEELIRVFNTREMSQKQCIEHTLQWARNIASTGLSGKTQPFYNPHKISTVFTPNGCKQV